jgi:hypothetical protein
VTDIHAEDVTAEALPRRERWTCTRNQLTDAIDGITVQGAKLPGRETPVVVADHMADAILSHLPRIGEGFTVVATASLRAVLADAARLTPNDVATWNECAEAAGLVTHA